MGRPSKETTMQGTKIDPAMKVESEPAGRRGAGSVLYTLVGFVAGCVAMFGSLSLLHADAVQRSQGSSGSASAGSLASPSDGSENATSVEDVLRMHIPERIIGSCQVGSSRDVQSFAYTSVVCNPGDPVEEVQYSTFHDAVAMRTEYATDLAMAHLTGRAGDCSRVAFGQGRWWSSAERTDAQGEVVHQIGMPMAADATGGRFMCYPADGKAWIEWIDGDTHIYGWASAPQDAYAALYNWWVNEAGPFHPPMEGMPGGPATPLPTNSDSDQSVSPTMGMSP
jgi:hypothetical protein